MRKKILVINEDKKNVGLFGKALEPKGFEVYAIGTPDKGIEKAIEIEPDLIFVDLIFQDSNGLKVSKLLHAVDKLKKVPIIMLISHKSDLDPKYTSTIGVVDVLLQPFTADDIISKTFSVLGEDADIPAMEEMAAELTEDEEFEAFAELGPEDHEFVSEADRLIDQAILKHDGEKKKIFELEDNHQGDDVIHLRKPESSEHSIEGPADYKLDEETAMQEQNQFDEPEEKKDNKIKKTFDAELPGQTSHETPADFDDEAAEEEKPATKNKIMMAVAGLLVIAGLGVGAYQIKKSFFSNETGKVPATTAPARTETVKDSLPSSDQIKPAEPAGTAPAPTTPALSAPASQQETRAVPAAPSTGTAEKEPVPAPKAVEKPTSSAATSAEKKEPKSDAKEVKKETGQVKYSGDKANFKFSVQTGYFENEKNAESAADKLKENGYEAFVLKNKVSKKGPTEAKIFYRVLIGRFENIKKAEAQARTMRQKEGLKVIIYRS